jgi:hypothetical protein
MGMPSQSMRDLARRLLATSQTASDPRAHKAARVFETLRASLTRFAGADGFAALLRRAQTLASAEVPSLQSVALGPAGRLEGLDHVTSDAAVELAAQLLGLLETFVGESLTLILVCDAVPDASPDK